MTVRMSSHVHVVATAKELLWVITEQAKGRQL